uniref:Uncharacterized protein n=1 Tax=Labrus bergylta TaxID=56723 RepID=A0A3Q3FQH8_9LABR
MRGPQRTMLCVGALQAGLLALSAKRVLFDELVAWAAVQCVLWHADGKGQVAAHTADNDRGTDVAGLYPHLPAAALAATASTILKCHWQIFCGGLVHLLINIEYIMGPSSFAKHFNVTFCSEVFFWLFLADAGQQLLAMCASWKLSRNFTELGVTFKCKR